jgi:hypothetical protein
MADKNGLELNIWITKQVIHHPIILVILSSFLSNQSSYSSSIMNKQISIKRSAERSDHELFFMCIVDKQSVKHPRLRNKNRKIVRGPTLFFLLMRNNSVNCGNLVEQILSTLGPCCCNGAWTNYSRHVNTRVVSIKPRHIKAKFWKTTTLRLNRKKPRVSSKLLAICTDCQISAD